MTHINQFLLNKCKVESPGIYSEIEEDVNASSPRNVDYYLGEASKKDLARAYVSEVDRCRKWINRFLDKQEDLKKAQQEPEKFDLVLVKMLYVIKRRESLGDKVVLDFLISTLASLAHSRGFH